MLWRVTAAGRQRVAVGRRYWFDNRSRQPAGSVVVQATLQGRILFRHKEREQTVEAGDLLLFNWGEPSSYGQPTPLAEPYVCEWVQLSGAGLVEHLAVLRRRHGSVLRMGNDTAMLIELCTLAAVAQPLASTGSVDAAHAVHRFVMRLFEFAQQRREQQLAPVERAVEQMLRTPTLPWSLSLWAEQFDCSREHLSRVFRQRIGKPPAEWIAAARLRQAMQLLTTTELSVSAIARQCGYLSVHTLARQVRAATGKAPTAMREAS